MIKEFLKIAGVKNEKQFYNKYPSEAAFFKAHPNAKHLKSFKKGGEMKKLEQLTDFGNPPIAKDGEEVPKYQLAPAPIQPSTQGPIYDPFGVTTMGGQTPQYNVYPPYAGNYTGPVDQAAVNAFNPKTKAPSFGSNLLGKLGGPEGIGQLAGAGLQGVQGEKNWKNKKAASDTALKLSGLTLRAARSKDVSPIQKYQGPRPEDYIMSTAEATPKGLFQGTNTEILSTAQDGAMIGGNPTEIQNMYNPGDLYSDLGYEPMSESDVVKQYEEGGYIPKAQLGNILGQMGGVSGILNQVGGLTGTGANTSGLYSAIGNIGSKLVPGTAGAALGGIGALAQFAVNDQRARTLKNQAEAAQANLQTTGFESGVQGMFQGPLASVAKNGASVDSDYQWISHTWQPQVITKFGDVDVSDIHSIATEGMDTLRTGGRITQNNMYPQDMYALGGELKTTWGGYAEPISKNPHDESETVMFKAPPGIGYHNQSDGSGHTGIGVKYGDANYDSYTDYAEYGTKQADADVEVQKGEPAKKIDGNLVVAGAIPVSKTSAILAGMPELAGKKYQTAITKIAEDDAKLNQDKQSLANDIANHNDNTQFGLLDKKTKEIKMKGIDMRQLKNHIASNKLLDYQNDLNDHAEYLSNLYGKKVAPESIEKGKLKFEKESEQAKWGKAIKKAQTGYKSKYGIEPWKGNVQGPYKGALSASEFTTEDWDKVAENLGFKGKGNKEFEEFLLKDPRAKEIISKRHEERYGKGPWIDPQHFGYGWAAPELKNLGRTKMTVKAPEAEDDVVTPTPTSTTTKETSVVPITPQEKKKPDWLAGLNTLLPYLRKDASLEGTPTYYAEQLALATNQLQPVDARGVRTLLGSPYTIQRGAAKNDLIAQTRAAQKMAGGDPSALANIAAQSYSGLQHLNEQDFIDNQNLYAGVIDKNRAALNEQERENQKIFERQRYLQDLAKANTLSRSQAAVASMEEKKNRAALEAKEYQVYKNLFPQYTYTSDMKAVPTGLTLFQPGVVSGANVPALATNPYVAPGRTADKDKTSAKKGKIIKKNNFNGSIVKALKNI